MVALFALLGLIMVSGFLTRLPKDVRYLLPVAVVFTVLQGVVALLVAVALVFVLSAMGLITLLLSEVNALFPFILTLALVSGILLYWGIVAIMKWKPFDPRILTITEYIIQWSLIYITVYQVVYDNIIPQVDKSILQDVTTGTPTDLMSATLPALLAVWIAVIMYKVRAKLL